MMDEIYIELEETLNSIKDPLNEKEEDASYKSVDIKSPEVKDIKF
jgi:hypothetical protein